MHMKTALKPWLALLIAPLLGACVSTGSPHQGAAPTPTPLVFRWKVLLTGNVFQVKQAKQTGLPLTPVALKQVRIGSLVIPGTAIKRSGSPDLATRLAEQRTQNALQSAQRKKEALAKRQQQIEAQKAKLPSPPAPPFKTTATTENIQLAFLPKGEFELAVPAGQALPGTVSMDVEHFQQPVVVPLLRQNNQTVIATASQDNQGKTQVSGRLNTSKAQSPVFQLRYQENDTPVFDLLQPSGQKSTWNINTLSQSSEADPFNSPPDLQSQATDAEFNQAWHALDPFFAEPSVSPANSSGGDNRWSDEGWGDSFDSGSTSGASESE